MSKSYMCAVHDKVSYTLKQSVKVISESGTKVENITIMKLVFFHEEPLNYSACIQTLHFRSGSYRFVMLEKNLMLNKFSCI